MAQQVYNGITFDDSVDYNAQLNSIKNGLYDAESYRNAKINATGSTNPTTNNYEKWSYNSGKDYNSFNSATDYQSQINSLVQQGIAAETKRNAKIAYLNENNMVDTPGYGLSATYDFIQRPDTSGIGKTADGSTLSGAVSNVVDSGINAVQNAGNDYVNNVRTIDPEKYYAWKNNALQTEIAQLDNNYADDVAQAKRTYNDNVQKYESQKSDVEKAYLENINKLYEDTYYNNAKLQEIAAERGIGNTAIGLSLVNSGLVNAANMSAYYRSLKNNDINQIETSLNRIASDLNVDLDRLESKLKNDKVYALNKTEQAFLELILEIDTTNIETYNGASRAAYESLADAINSGTGYKSSALATESEQAFQSAESEKDRAMQKYLGELDASRYGSSGYGSGGYSYGGYGGYKNYGYGGSYGGYKSSGSASDDDVTLWAKTVLASNQEAAFQTGASAYYERADVINDYIQRYQNGDITAEELKRKVQGYQYSNRIVIDRSSQSNSSNNTSNTNGKSSKTNNKASSTKNGNSSSIAGAAKSTSTKSTTSKTSTKKTTAKKSVKKNGSAGALF